MNDDLKSFTREGITKEVFEKVNYEHKPFNPIPTQAYRKNPFLYYCLKFH